MLCSLSKRAHEHTTDASMIQIISLKNPIQVVCVCVSVCVQTILCTMRFDPQRTTSASPTPAQNQQEDMVNDAEASTDATP